MSTRACIKVKQRVYLTDADMEKKKLTEREIVLYHHSDGYPSGVGSDLKKYIDEVVSKRQYGWHAEEIATELVRGAIKDDDGESDMGYECAICQHGDCQYGYEIDCDAKTLKCYELDWDELEWKEENVVEIP